MKFLFTLFSALVLISLTDPVKAETYHMPTDKIRPLCLKSDPTITFEGINDISVDVHVMNGAGIDGNLFDDLLGQHVVLFFRNEASNSLNKIFVDANHHRPVDDWIKIEARSPDSDKLDQPNVLQFNFFISGRHETIDGKAVSLASLGLQIYKSGAGGSLYRYVTETYPFIVPDNKEALKKQIYDGVFALTKYLPSQFCGAAHRQDCDYNDPYRPPPMKF